MAKVSFPKPPWWTWYTIQPNDDPATVTLKVRLWHPLLWWVVVWALLRSNKIKWRR